MSIANDLHNFTPAAVDERCELLIPRLPFGVAETVADPALEVLQGFIFRLEDERVKIADDIGEEARPSSTGTLGELLSLFGQRDRLFHGAGLNLEDVAYGNHG